MYESKAPISPLKEITAYESLWEREDASFKYLAELFNRHPGSRPSDFVDEQTLAQNSPKVKETVLNNPLNYRVSFTMRGTFDYPTRLKDAKEQIELLYYSGFIDLLSTKSLAVVGTRNPSEEGRSRARKLVRQLVQNDFTIVSGLAQGIDTVAHTTAIAEKGRTIAVIGTPMDTVYPKDNVDLQGTIARDHLLISQVPYMRYKRQTFHGNRLFFPERNKTMSALTAGTIIVEAGETSGTLIQARAALHQKRKLFILDSCFSNKNISWPERFLKQGAIRVRTIEDILREFPQPSTNEQTDKD